MQKLPVFLTLLFLAFSCSKAPFEKGSKLYKLAKALSIKYSVMHPDSGFVLAKTNDFELTSNDLLFQISRRRGNKVGRLRRLSPLKLKQRIRELAHEYTMNRVLQERADAAGIQASAADVDSAYKEIYANLGSEQAFLDQLKLLALTEDDVKTDLRRSIKIKKYLESQLRDEIAVTDEEVRADFEMDKTATVRHILLSTIGKTPQEKKEVLARAKQVLRRLKRGEDIAALARDLSQDQNTKDKGGLIQDVRRGVWEKPFEDAVFSTPVGEISDIVETRFGYHIIKVIERKKDHRFFEDAEASIRARLRKEKMAAAKPGFMKKVEEEVGYTLLVSDL